MVRVPGRHCRRCHRAMTASAHAAYIRGRHGRLLRFDVARALAKRDQPRRDGGKATLHAVASDGSEDEEAYSGVQPVMRASRHGRQVRALSYKE